MPIEKFAIIIGGCSITLILVSISYYIALIFGLIFFSIFIYMRFDLGKFKYLKKYFHRNYHIEFFENEIKFAKVSGYIFTVLEIENMERYTDSQKKRYMESVKIMVEGFSSNFNIITKTEAMGKYNYYQSFLILKQNNNNKDAENIIKRDVQHCENFNQIKIVRISDENTIESLFNSDLKPFKNYSKSHNQYSSYIDVIDMDYSMDFLYQSVIEKLGYSIELNMDVEKINNPDMLIQRLMASRKAEMAYSKTGQHKANIQKQVMSLEQFAKSNGIYNVYWRFKIVSEHPVALKKNTENLMQSFKKIGITLNLFKYYSRWSGNPLFLYRDGKKYLMDAASISNIFPGGFTEKAESGYVMGYNSITGKPVPLDIFSSSSYNIAITGETGSGKSFFSKIIVDLYSSSSTIYIIDPLNEYNNGEICNIEQGEYLDFMVNIDIANVISHKLSILSEIDSALVNKEIIRSNSEKKYYFSDIIKRLKDNSDYHCNMSFLEKYFIKPVAIKKGTVIIKYDSGNEKFKNSMMEFILASLSSIVQNTSGNKVIIIDEAHLFLKNEETAEFIDMIARNSRHFNTSLITVTQNIDDYYMNKYSESILKNTMNFFIFRQKEKINKKLFLDYNISPDLLKGGKDYNYSECFFVKGSLIRKVNILKNKSITAND